MEIGIDIEENERFKNLKENVITRAFTKTEIENARKHKKDYEVFCAIWCVKESLIKATSNRMIPFQEIEVLAQSDGKPYIKLNQTIKAELEKMGLKEIKISMSHANTYSTAVCLIC